MVGVSGFDLVLCYESLGSTIKGGNSMQENASEEERDVGFGEFCILG